MISKKQIFISLVVIIASAALYFSSKKPEVMVIEQEMNFSNIAVKDFPLTESGKIEWWEKNKEALQKKYNIPQPANNGDWYINVWDYGDGFKEKPKGDIRVFNSQTQDMLCFNNDEGKCIEKDLIMRIENNKDGSESVEIGDNKKVLK